MTAPAAPFLLAASDRPRLRPGEVDASHPGFAVAVLFAVTAFPYLYPFHHNPFPRYWPIGEHLVFCVAFFVVNAGAVLLYQAVFVPLADGRPRAYNPDFLALFLSISRVFIWVSVAANLGLVAYLLPHYQGNLIELKQVMLAKLEGVNIITQSFLYFLGPFIFISLIRRRPMRLELAALGVALLLRAMVMSERVAFFEFLVPLVVVLAQWRVLRVTVTRLFAFGLFVPVFFVLSELTRSFYSKFVSTGGWSNLDLGFIIGWNLERLFIYYADTVNKFYFVVTEQYFHLTQAWADGVLRILGRLDLLGRAPEEGVDLMAVAELFGARHKEMTNPGGLTLLVADFGWAGGAAYLLLLVMLLAGHFFAARGALFAVGVYPVLYITMLEMGRYVYLYETRSLFPLFLFLSAYGACLVVTGAPRAHRA